MVNKCAASKNSKMIHCTIGLYSNLYIAGYFLVYSEVLNCVNVIIKGFA